MKSGSCCDAWEAPRPTLLAYTTGAPLPIVLPMSKLLTLGSELAAAEGAQKPQLTEEELAIAAAKRQQRIVLGSFAAILIGGLALAATYLGGRVTQASAKTPEVKQESAKVAAAESTSTTQAEKTILQPVATLEQIDEPVAEPGPSIKQEVAEKPEPAEKAPASQLIDSSVGAMLSSLPKASQPYSGPMIEPKPGELYVQVGAYGPSYTPSFLALLEGRGFQASVALGATPDVYRILVGPISNHDELQRTFDRLQQAGFTGAVNRTY